jgi:hypothetical protein
MRIVARYPFKKANEVVPEALLKEIEQVVEAIDARAHQTKYSKEKTKQSRQLYNPKSLNAQFKEEFKNRGWKREKVYCQYSANYYVSDYEPTRFKGPQPFREMDFVKEKLGVEVQFGKYAFMVYDVCAKMIIFHKLGHIDCGVEIVPVRGFTRDMSTGVAYFEQFVWDLEKRGSGEIDIPVLVLGIDVDILIEVENETKAAQESKDIVQQAVSEATGKRK